MAKFNVRRENIDTKHAVETEVEAKDEKTAIAKVRRTYIRRMMENQHFEIKKDDE